MQEQDDNNPRGRRRRALLLAVSLMLIAFNLRTAITSLGPVLLDAIAGRLNLFVRSDEQEQAWRWVEPILDAWEADPSGPRPYSAGSLAASAAGRSVKMARKGLR